VNSTFVPSVTPGSIVRVKIQEREIAFFVTDGNDLIQRQHSFGKFYEPEEIGIISEYFQRGGIFADIGANVGNHTIYVAKYLEPRRIVVIEPNPAVLPILKANIALNGLQQIVDDSSLGYGISDKAGRAFAQAPSDNIGAARMRPTDDSGPIPLVAGDSLLKGRRIDFMKIDVEGMELRALAGLAATIADQRPRIFIEVEDVNRQGFDVWVSEHGYKVMQMFRRYKTNENFMLLPIEKIA
jgi:FkbM family methyltransferase